MYALAGGFVFRTVDSAFHRLDPRIKLVISLEFFVLSLVSSSVTPLLILFGAQLSISVLAGSVKRIGRAMLFSLGFAAFIFVINVFFGIGLRGSIVYSLRFVAIVGSTSIFFLTTSPDELEQIMKWIKVPRDIVFAFTTAVRFIPVIMLDALQIMDAQKSRGLELEKGNVIVRIRNLVPVMVPLVVNSVIRSGELAEAMESRAYGATSKPTSLYVLSLRWRDRLTIFGSLILFIVTLYIYIRAPFPY